MKLIKVHIGYKMMTFLAMVSSLLVSGQDPEKTTDSKESSWYNIKYEWSTTGSFTTRTEDMETDAAEVVQVATDVVIEPPLSLP